MTLILVAGLPSCTRKGEPSGRFRGAASIAPLSSLLRTVAGEGWDIHTIVPPGISAHVFEPTPSDAARLARVDLVVTVGGGYDPWITKMVEACASKARVLDTAGFLGLAPEESHDEDEHGHAHAHSHSAGHDPHWWLSPRLAVEVLPELAATLSRVDPAGAAGYVRRSAELEASILELDGEIERHLAPRKGTGFVSAHPAWTHFALRYGLTQIGSIEPAPGRDPSPWEIRQLIDGARKGGSSTLFTEPQFSTAAATAIASDAGLSLALVDPIGGVPGRMSYVEMMRFNMAAFEKGLARKAGGL
ncbi:MAG: zinc ABC transporter substrate-binding protein [Acidobacteria bacterium]|nr:zinc ABC transporter substrate-binding protein [Acidobacteriota bacterium]